MEICEAAFQRLLKFNRPDEGVDLGHTGLHLDPPLRHGGYECTPTNAMTFAWTCGDGVHFSFLVDEELLAREICPVVMTVPHAEPSNNIVLGENLNEFLCLGCRRGYFSLEDLMYDRAETIDELASGVFHADASEEEIAVLRALTAEFGLAPWAEVEARLQELEQLYFAVVDLAPGA